MMVVLQPADSTTPRSNACHPAITPEFQMRQIPCCWMGISGFGMPHRAEC